MLVAEIAFQVLIAYAHTGKDHRDFWMVVQFTFVEGIAFLEGITVHPL
jgi:hypothetical protein